jgi:Flp pilus assembly protein TadG
MIAASQPHRPTRPEARDARRAAAWRRCEGAAYVEFIIAIVPMLTLFWGIMQLNGLLLADLVVRHAAVSAVRAAIVCDSQIGDPQDTGTLEGSSGCSWNAANMTLSAIKSFGAPPDFTVDIQGASRQGNDLVTATVNASYHCQVPLVGSRVCGASILDGSFSSFGSGTVVLTRKASLPNQGVNYVLAPHGQLHGVL